MLFKKSEEYEKKIILHTYRLFKSKDDILGFFYQTFLRTIYFPIRYEYYLKKQYELFLNYEEEGEYISCSGTGWGALGKTRKQDYYDRILYEFENLKVWGMRNYDHQLRKFYGDFMTLPPKEKRINPHDSNLYVSKRIYEKYIEK